MAKMRHIALIVPDPEEAAKFFEAAFDLKRAGKARRGALGPTWTPSYDHSEKQRGASR